METRFELAPPPRRVDGLDAAPMDIQHLAASLVFDAATQQCAVDATIDFVVAPGGGCPIFDLRQTIARAWLDGAPIDPALLSHHDFGDPDARLRVLARRLDGGTRHALRLAYTLGRPDAPAPAWSPPTYAWDGPRLTFCTSFSDLNPARYLEAWLPANLVFDAFGAAIEIRIANTNVPHAVITNAALREEGPNHVHLRCPPGWCALSMLLQIRPADAVDHRASEARLPDGRTIAIACWKPAGSRVDLDVAGPRVARYLARDVERIGPYLHGDRFTVVFEGTSGGMEYAGACTTAPGSLQHEVHHSWWGRGVVPASQDDGWIDEAWTVHEVKRSPAAALDFRARPVALCARDPWRRATPIESYGEGRALFQGLGAIVGTRRLRAAMRALYPTASTSPLTTLALEAHLVARLGRPEIVDAFHRFVYGLFDPRPASRLALREDRADPGAIWARRDDDGDFLYARVRNHGRGAARHFMVVFGIHRGPGEPRFPDDFLPGCAATGGFELPPGGEAIVRARSPGAAVVSDGTLVACVIARNDHPSASRPLALASRRLAHGEPARGVVAARAARRGRT